MAFLPLHIYSAYSFLKSGFTMDRLFNSLRRKHYTAAGISDLNGMYGLPEFFALAQRYGMPAIAGMDVTIDGDLLSLYVTDEAGYLNLCALASALSLKPLTWQDLKDHAAGLIAVLSLRESRFATYFNQDQKLLAPYLARWSEALPTLYLGIENYDQNDQPLVEFARYFAQEHGYECVAFPWIRYDNPGDAVVTAITEAIAEDRHLDRDVLDGPYYLYDEDQIFERYTGVEITNTERIVKACRFVFSQKRGAMLRYPVPADLSADDYLGQLAIDALIAKGLPLDDTRYLERLQHELSIIKDMGYSDYFLIVRDYVAYAKDHDIPVGPGRGSAAGSLVSFVLGITDIDPIQYDLLFERFLNPARKSMPDIDIDFADIRRDEIIHYLREKYGADRVANIVTFQTIGARQAFRDIGRVFNVEEKDIALLSKMITDNRMDLRSAYKTNPALRDLIDKEPYYLNIMKLATKIEGLIRQAGMHAAGVVLNDTPIDQAIPVVHNGEITVTQFEMNYLEEQGFLKMDVLGLRNLSTIASCVALINANHHLTLKAAELPFNDPRIFPLIASGRTMGIFQLETPGMKKAIETLAPASFDDVVALLALYRPGPMDNIPTYAARKAGLEKVTFINPDLKDILAPTYGIIVYQEQIMQIAVKMAGFTMADADSFRRAISKKDAEKLAALQKAFIGGAVRQGYNDKHAESVFNHIYKFADYGFNKSHSVSYAVLACQMAYLKAVYPAEFYAAILETASGSNDVKFADYISEIKEQNIRILSPDINLSEAVFSVNKGALLFPLSAIKNVPGPAVEAIVHERAKGAYSDFFQFVDRIYPYKVNATHVTRLIEAGCFDALEKSRATLIASLPAAFQYAAMHNGTDGQLPIDLSFLPKPALVRAKDDPLENLNREYEVIGLMISGSPLRYKKDQLSAQKVVDLATAKDRHDTINVAGILKAKKVIKTKKGTPMAFLSIYDDTADMEVVVFPNAFSEASALLEKNATLIITGHADREKKNTFVADKIRLLED